MKTVRKALLATAVAAALSPAAVMADTTLFGNFDIAVGIESGAESALAVEDSPSGDNVIGVEGNIELENGNEVTYQYVVNVDVDGDSGAGFGANYHSYIGYKWDSLEVRAGNQDLPLRLALDKADLFAGTYADFSNIVGGNGSAGNTTAPSSVMLLGGNETIKYAFSADVGSQPVLSTGLTAAQGLNCTTTTGTPPTTSTTAAENANCKDANDALRIGAMADFAVNENISVAAGLESASDRYNSFGISSNIGLTESLSLNVAINLAESDATNNKSETTEIYLGGAFTLNDTTTLKLAYGMADGKNAAGVSATDEATTIAVGADFALAENVTTYVLYAQGEDKGGVVGSNLLHTVEEDAQGEGSVLAAGIKLSF